MIGQLTNHLWQSTGFGLAVAILAFFFRKSGAHVRYGLWFSASIKFFLPFAFLIALGRQLEWAPVVREAASTTVSATMVRISEPFFEATPTVLPAAPASRRTIGWIAMVLPAIWACGCLTIALIRVRLWRRIRIIVRASTPLTVPGIETPPGLQIRSTEALLEPGVVGLWRPALLLPAGLERDLTPSQLRAVVSHEVSHVRRRDNLTAGVHMLVEVIFWFHPLVWWIGSRLVDERERACDEEVLRLLGEPEAYAEGILAVCKRYVESPLSCVSGVSGSNIRKRIEGIMNNRTGTRLTFGRIAVLTFAALFAFATPIVVGSMKTALPRPFAPAPPTVPTVEVLSSQQEKAPVIVQSPQATTPQAAKVASVPPAAVPEFEEASIRQCDPDNLPVAPEGMRGGGANSFQMTPGRTHALCMTLATLIRTAYGYGPADLEFLNPGGRGRGLAFNNVYGLGVEDGIRVRGGPDWLRKERYSIEAVASGASDPATMQGPMLRALLERRFQLKTHIEGEQIPAFALTVGRSGLKVKPAPEGSCERLPPPTPGVPNIVRPRNLDDLRRGEKPTCGMIGQRNGPNMVYVAGEAPLEALARALGGNLGRVQVLDKTGITDKFNFIFEFAIDENAPGFNPSPDTAPPEVPRAASIYTALEEQLGLRLEPDKTSRSFIVVDHVERPSPN
jgi:bla regulator protein blaR1